MKTLYSCIQTVRNSFGLSLTLVRSSVNYELCDHYGHQEAKAAKSLVYLHRNGNTWSFDVALVSIF